ncbi:MAG: hypothetical protein NZM05_12475, partial [Chloroherpetonaceae bacterium]|nr:hypothetical protein [Chloroherpetonaceae bacterium]
KRNGGKWNYLKTDGTLLSELDFDSKPHMRAKDWIRVDIDGKTQYITTRYGILSDSLSETYEEIKIERMRDALSIWLSSSQT